MHNLTNFAGRRRVGPPRREDVLIAKDVLRQKVPCKVYALSVKAPREVRRPAWTFSKVVS